MLAPYLLTEPGAAAPEPISVKGKTVGYRRGKLAIAFKRRVDSATEQRELAHSQELERLIVMTDKYQWVESRMNNGRLERYAEGRKPKRLVLHLSRN